MKYAIIPYIAIGLILSLAVGIEYKCEGKEIFPAYYGSPFVFKQTSLVTSMEYYYSISGLIINVLLWSFVLFIIDKAVQTLIDKMSNPKVIRISYNIIIGLMIGFTTFNIVIGSLMIAPVFAKGSNYWYWDIDIEAKDWGMTCKGELVIFGK